MYPRPNLHPNPHPIYVAQGTTDGVRHSASGSGGDPIRSIAERRFQELDRDGSGKVSFLEVGTVDVAFRALHSW